MKIVAIGDIHGDPLWKYIVGIEKDADLFIFLGDYFDSFVYSTTEQINNFLDIIQFKRDNMDKVILLIGNHDEHYYTRYSGTSGYQQLGETLIKPALLTNKDIIQLAYSIDNLLFTHAGVSPVFMDNVFGVDSWNIDNMVELLNEIFKYQPLFIKFDNALGKFTDSSGDNDFQSPVWIRPRSLMKANEKSEIKKKFIQIVGHTQQNQIDIEGKSTGGRYYFIDTINTNREYLIIENGKFSSKTIAK
jgi:hypothetical protein